MTHLADAALLRLTLARACAWALLVAGWVGIGSFALQFAPSVSFGFALVALWLVALGGAATVATRGGIRRGTRALALCVGAAITGVGLSWSVHGGGVGAVLLALVGWAALTALASGVVRSLRLAQAAAPAPPVAAASLGALCAALALGDLGDLPALAIRLTIFVAATAALLVLLQRRIDEGLRAPGCRAGLFDCSLPAWPAGAWREPRQWPMLLAGLAMLPMMAALPLMAAWCSAQRVAPQAMVLLHLAAMFGPPLVLRATVARWSPRTLSAACTLLLAAGAACASWAAAPLDLLGLAVTHGAAWGLAWSGQLWAPARRGRQGASPLRAAAGYAVLTLAFGLVVEHFGVRGVTAMHAALGLAAVLAWLLARAANPWSRTMTQRPRSSAPAAGPPARHGGAVAVNESSLPAGSPPPA
ncbi:MAG TPA: hypothetical protein VKP68_13075 [Ramlibacter sp.]|nr:hypothetical protein [Ramlibacter sp.]